jgi:hypothetical protein
MHSLSWHGVCCAVPDSQQGIFLIQAYNWQMLQDPFGRTPLHVAASVGAVRTCDAIVTADTSGINMVDIFGTTALDNARSKKQAAVEAIVLAQGGLPGDDPRVEKEHKAVREYVERKHAVDRQQRRQRVLKELPEFQIRLNLSCVDASLQKFMEVRLPFSACFPRSFVSAVRAHVPSHISRELSCSLTYNHRRVDPDIRTVVVLCIRSVLTWETHVMF